MTILFHGRKVLADAFEKWADENKVDKCPVSVITWLGMNELINENRAVDIINAIEAENNKAKCENCEHFEKDVFANVGGIPIIICHNICNKWGNGCKTDPDGFCHNFKRRESKEAEE